MTELTIERIAREMHASRPQATAWEDEAPSVKDVYRGDARAAVRALRDPGLPLKLIGAEAITLDLMKARANYCAASDCWDAMLGAILAEQQ